MLNGLDLFSGIGGIAVALRDYVRPIAYCEIDTYCQGVLLSRMARGDLCCAPIWDDVRTMEFGSHDATAIDILYGGFPCQGISVAGLGKGLADERSGLFWEIVRLAKEIKPKFIFLENVPAITTRGGLTVVSAIAEMGYDCRWCIISAASVGALHRRERWFLLGYTKHYGRNGTTERGSPQTSVHPCQEGKDEACEPTRASASAMLASESLAYANSSRCNKEQRGQPCGLQQEHTEFTDRDIKNDGDPMCEPSEQAYTGTESEQAGGRTWRGSTRQYWPFESREHWQEAVGSVCRTSDGLPFHVDRLRALGNAVVPIQAKEAFEILMGIK